MFVCIIHVFTCIYIHMYHICIFMDIYTYMYRYIHRYSYSYICSYVLYRYSYSYICSYVLYMYLHGYIHRIGTHTQSISHSHLLHILLNTSSMYMDKYLMHITYTYNSMYTYIYPHLHSYIHIHRDFTTD